MERSKIPLKILKIPSAFDKNEEKTGILLKSNLMLFLERTLEIGMSLV